MASNYMVRVGVAWSMAHTAVQSSRVYVHDEEFDA